LQWLGEPAACGRVANAGGLTPPGHVLSAQIEFALEGGPICLFLDWPWGTHHGRSLQQAAEAAEPAVSNFLDQINTRPQRQSNSTST